MSLLRPNTLATLSRLLGSCALAFLATTGAACALDSVGPDQMGEGPYRIPADDPAIDERLNQLDIICESTLSVTGTFAPGIPQPDGMNGCWPVGTWTLSATVDRLGCDPQPDLIEDFVYEVTFDEENSTHDVAFQNDPADDRVNLKISTAGDSLCHGSMDHFGLDNVVWGFRPTLQLDNTLVGTGTYSVYSFDSF